MTRIIKFRQWDRDEKHMYQDTSYLPISPDYKVMQFTGLLDKNGKEIYEGDLVKWDGGIYPIEFYSGGFRFRPFKAPHDHMWLSTADETDREVVGSIYENNDLLL